MSIVVVCPNGHSLKVSEDCAGRTGRCPICKAKVEVPRPEPNLSEDAILGILGPHDPEESAIRRASPKTPSRVDRRHVPSPPKKPCNRCNQEIPVTAHICPHCHTYIAGLSDF